jgi:hypothetical protein
LTIRNPLRHVPGKPLHPAFVRRTNMSISTRAASPQRASAQRPEASAYSFPITATWSMEALLALSRQEIVDLWKSLPAATLDELQGHFMGLVPNGGDPERQLGTSKFMYDENSEKGYWLGKAYRKKGPNEGEGYNRWRYPGGRIVRNMRFTTEVGPSLFDGKPSLLMYYGAYNAKSPSFVDEIRKLDTYVYLGVGSVLNPDGKRSEPGHFMLVGPTDEWVGDATGELVQGFVKPTR